MSRERAKEAIRAGDVKVNGQTVRKPAAAITENDCIEVRGNSRTAYVGRGYLKLEKALNTFHIDVSGMRCLDVGASTGGFTQLLLARGASEILAVDVGTGQLARELREDTRVVNLEKTDIRTLTAEQIGEVAFACADVSFISLQLVLPVIFSLLDEAGAVVCLLKPQFEAGPRGAGKRGVVKDPKVHAETIKQVLACAQAVGFSICGVTHSPIRGGGGQHRIFVIFAQKAAGCSIA